MTDINWRRYLYGFTTWAALKSKDTTQVRAILVGPEREVRLTAPCPPPPNHD